MPSPHFPLHLSSAPPFFPSLFHLKLRVIGWFHLSLIYLRNLRQRQKGISTQVSGKVAGNRRRGSAQWFRTAMNREGSTGPLARPFTRTAHSVACSALLTSLARSALLRSFVRSLADSLTHGKVDDQMSCYQAVLNHCAAFFAGGGGSLETHSFSH